MQKRVYLQTCLILEHGQPLIHVLAILGRYVAAVTAQRCNVAVCARNICNGAAAGVVSWILDVNSLPVLQG